MRKRLLYDQGIDAYQTFDIPLPHRVRADVLTELELEADIDDYDLKHKLFMKDKQTQKFYTVILSTIFPPSFIKCSILSFILSRVLIGRRASFLEISPLILNILFV